MLAFLTLPGCAGIVVAALDRMATAQKAEDVKFPDDAKDAYMLILAEPSAFPYTLLITEYDERNQKLVLDSIPENTFVTVDASNAPVYLAKILKPGRYVFSELRQQAEWAACFSENTLSFSVNAGGVVFLGDFQPKANLAQIQREAAADGSTTVRGFHIMRYYKDIIPPQITAPVIDGADFLLAKRYEASSLPSLHGRLQPVVYKSAKFIPRTVSGFPQCLQN